VSWPQHKLSWSHQLNCWALVNLDYFQLSNQMMLMQDMVEEIVVVVAVVCNLNAFFVYFVQF